MKSFVKRMSQKVFYFFIPSRILIVKGKKQAACKKTIYLTYDDGPNPEVTPPLLDALDSHGAKATFFVIGEFAEKHPEIVKDIVSRGHSIANHSYLHRRFSSLSLTEKIDEIDRTNKVIFDITGEECKIFRSPQGVMSFKLLFSLALKGIRTINWSRDSDDCRYGVSDVIENLRNTPLSDRDIVLMHDDNKDAIAITEGIFSNMDSSYSFQALKV